MPLSDSSGTFMRILRPKPSPAVLLMVGSRRLRGLPVLVHEASRRALGSSTTQDRTGTRDIAPARVAFRQCKSVSVLIASFRSSISSPPVPLFTLRHTPRGVQRKTRGRAVRYSFLAGLLHSLLHAGLSRRTALAIWRKRRPCGPGLCFAGAEPVLAACILTLAEHDNLADEFSEVSIVGWLS